MDQTGFTGGFSFLTQIADIDLDDVALAAEVVLPDSIENHLTRKDLARMQHQQFEQHIFLGGQLNDALAANGLTRSRIEFQV